MAVQPRGTLNLILLLCCFVTCILTQGPLGVHWNQNFATNRGSHKMAWMSVLEFNQEIDTNLISDQQLTGLARDAWNEMQADHQLRPWAAAGIGDRRAGDVPTVMVAMTRGKKVYLTSSMRSCAPRNEAQKNLGYIYNPALNNGWLQQALIECQMVTTSDDAHRTGANCGEQLAAILAFNDEEVSPKDLTGSRMVSWVNLNGGMVIPPCGAVPDQAGNVVRDPGCYLFMDRLKATIIPMNTPPAALHAPFQIRAECLRLF